MENEFRNTEESLGQSGGVRDAGYSSPDNMILRIGIMMLASFMCMAFFAYRHFQRVLTQLREAKGGQQQPKLAGKSAGKKKNKGKKTPKKGKKGKSKAH
jgi:hypothetical protein